MKVYRDLKELPQATRGAAVTIGNFDGVHRGHLKVIARLNDLARKHSGISVAVTFDPHPQKLFRGEAPPALLTLEAKIERLHEAGIDRLLILKFDRSLSLVEPEDFISQVLVQRLNAKVVVVGSSFRFGHKARGDTTMLRTFGKRLGFDCEGVRIARLAGRSVSSTEIRHALQRGDVSWATRALGRPHFVPGLVIKGKRRGKKLGVPTANLRPQPGICIPAMGVYAGTVRLGKRKKAAALSVGTNPTFGENPLSIEAHILDFDDDLYGDHAEFHFVRFLREQEVFGTSEDLSAQMQKDVEMTRRAMGSLLKH